MERNVTFLSKELGVMEPHEADERVFFVSALETLQTALASDGDSPTKARPHLLEGFQTRLVEFTKFEKIFQVGKFFEGKKLCALCILDVIRCVVRYKFEGEFWILGSLPLI